MERSCEWAGCKKLATKKAYSVYDVNNVKRLCNAHCDRAVLSNHWLECGNYNEDNYDIDFDDATSECDNCGRVILGRERDCGCISRYVVDDDDFDHAPRLPVNTRCDCDGTTKHSVEGGYVCPVAFANDGGNV